MLQIRKEIGIKTKCPESKAVIIPIGKESVRHKAKSNFLRFFMVLGFGLINSDC